MSEEQNNHNHQSQNNGYSQSFNDNQVRRPVVPNAGQDNAQGRGRSLQPNSGEYDGEQIQNNQNHSPQKQNGVAQSSQSYSPETRDNDHNCNYNESATKKKKKNKFLNIPGLIVDELTEYAMAREGIDPDDLMPKPIEDFIKECNGNAKLAQIRFEYKEAERQSLLQDIENRKNQIKIELSQEQEQTSNFQSIITPQNQQTHNGFFNTHKPSLMTSKYSRMSHSHAQFHPHTPNGQQSQSVRGLIRSGSKNQVDNKIFENMLKNQVKQEVKLRQIQERQEMFLMKANQLQEKRQREIQRKQEQMHQKQLQKEEKLKKQEEQQRQWQQETLQKLKYKSEITEARQQKFKHDFKVYMQQKEQHKAVKRQHAQEMYNQYLESLQQKQQEVEVKGQEFQKKLDEKSRKQKEVIVQKKIKKEQVLQNVQEQREQEEYKKMERFMQAQFLEMEKERRIEEEKNKQQYLRKKKGLDKQERLVFKVEEAYRKMAEWQSELERREKQAADNLKKQQKILAEKLEIKREMQRLRQESAQLKQKRKDNKEKLQNEEQMKKLESMYEKMEKFKQDQQLMKLKKKQEIFKAEQKRADMKTAFYHMAVWNVNEAGDIIQEILEENDKGNGQAVKPKSVAEKVREKAAKIRRDERLGFSRISPTGYEGMNFIQEEDSYHNDQEHLRNGHDFERVRSNDYQEIENGGHGNGRPQNSENHQKIVYDQRQQ